MIGVGRSEPSLAEARRLGAVDETTTDLAAGVATANLVVVASSVVAGASVVVVATSVDAAVLAGASLDTVRVHDASALITSGVNSNRAVV